MTSLKKLLRKKNYHPISLIRTGTNHFEIKAELNGVEGRFILDTGASNTCVGIDLAERFNLMSEVSEIKAAGAGARDMETHISKKNNLKIGDWQNKKQSIVLFDLVHVNEALTAHNAKTVDGIIGADVLNKARAIIDYKKKRVYLKRG